MTKTRSPRTRVKTRRLGTTAILAALAIGAQVGCTREFFREWANQDVSEAVFEKSRDPRWRLDLFSVEPPALSRFADPYDQEVPPAPPDDPVAEALSPVPQWPDNRLLIPVEGSGYLELLDRWRREADEAQQPPESSDTASPTPTPVLEPARPPRTPSPFAPPASPAGNKPPTGTVSPPGAQPPPGLPPARPNPLPGGPQTRNQVRPRDDRIAQTSSPSSEPKYSGAQALYQAQPTSGSTSNPATIVRTQDKPASAASVADRPSGSDASKSKVGPMPIGPQAWNPARPAGVLPITSETIIRLQDGPPMRPAQAVFGKTDITDRSNRISGPNSTGSTPISVSKVNPSTAKPKVPLPRAAATFGDVRRDGAIDVKDKTVKRAAFQNNGTAAQPGATQPPGAAARTARPTVPNSKPSHSQPE